MTEKWLTTNFIIIGIIVFICFYFVIFMSAQQFYSIGITPTGAVQANQTDQQITQIRETTTYLSIFTNNLRASIILLLPAAGLISFLFVLFNTGQVMGLLAAFTGIDPFSYLLSTAIPVGIMEISAYTILGAETTYVLALAVNRNGAMDRIKHHSWKSFLAYIVILFFAAIIEAVLIKGF